MASRADVVKEGGVSVYLRQHEIDGDVVVEHRIIVDGVVPPGWIPAEECESGPILSYVYLVVERGCEDLDWPERCAAHRWLSRGSEYVYTGRSTEPRQFYALGADGDMARVSVE